eukprot:3210664-Prymnesium_polylepis.1
MSCESRGIRKDRKESFEKSRGRPSISSLLAEAEDADLLESQLTASGVLACGASSWIWDLAAAVAVRGAPWASPACRSPSYLSERSSPIGTSAASCEGSMLEGGAASSTPG